MPLALLIFPDQLIKSSTTYPKDTIFFVVEDSRFFRTYRFHKQKLVFHRASMQAFRERLLIKGYAVHYCDTVEYRTLANVCKYIAEQGTKELSYFSVTNHTQRSELLLQAKKHGIELNEQPTVTFLNPTLPEKLPSETTAYALIRQELNLLMDGAKPRGGIWEYKTESKHHIQNIDVVPLPPEVEIDRYIEEAMEYVQIHFPKNPGSLGPLRFPVTYADSQDWLESFLDERFEKYGTLGQSMHAQGSLLYSPGISLLLNVGLLTPQQVIDQASERLKHCLAPLNSVERLFRKVVGAREYARASYLRAHNDPQPVLVPKVLLEGKTGVLPVDVVIERLLQTGYANDAERRYILCAFAILLELPIELTISWFSSLMIDSASWSLCPTLEALYENPKSILLTSQKLTTLSGFAAGDWSEIWDSLYNRYNDMHGARGISLRPFGRATTARAESYIHALSGHSAQEKS